MGMGIKIDPATSELLAALAASVKELNTKAAEAGRQINAKLATNLAKLRESARKFKTGLPGKLKILAMNGWFIYGFRTPSQAIYPVASLFEAGRIEEGNQAMCWHFNNVLSDIETDLIKRFPKRELILKKAFAAHRSSDYELSIPVLLAQADGIARDVIAKEITGFSIYSKREDFRREVEIFIKKFAEQALFGSDILDVVLIKMPLNVSEGNPILTAEVLNRNAILHGINTSYPTELNSCRAVSWLDYVSYFQEISEK